MAETRLVEPATRETLRRCVAELALAIAAGDVTPLFEELQALAVACDEQGLPAEAARVRRWMQLPASGMQEA